MDSAQRERERERDITGEKKTAKEKAEKIWYIKLDEGFGFVHQARR